LLREGLVDELRLIVCPVALGAGISSCRPIAGPTKLKFASAKPYPNGAVQLTYRI
jgi:riboflavin biosynthesis pyrimidine reductase